MRTLQSTTSGWWVFVIVAIFALIGVIVFVLRKRIPGLAEYEEEDEQKIAEDNLSRILVDVEKDEKAEKEDDGEDR